MNLLLRIPMRFLLPLLIGGFAILIGVLSYLNTRPTVFENVRQEAKARTVADLTEAQGVLELLLRTENIGGARRFVASFGAEPGHELMFLADADGQILASTSLAQIGERWTTNDHPRVYEQLDRILDSGSAEVVFSEKHDLVSGYVRVCGTDPPQELRPSECGFLYLGQSIAEEKRRRADVLQTQMTQNAAGILLAALLLWILFHFLLAQRAQQLIKTVRAFAEGDAGARTNLSGNDELAQISTSLDSMLDKIISDEEGLRIRERAMLDSSNGILITDATGPDHPIIYCNPAFETITGYTQVEVIGKNCRFLQNDDRDQPAIREMREATSEGCECRVLLRNYRKDGNLFWNELTISPVRDEKGEMTHFVGIQNDVSERVMAEAQRSNFSRILEASVNEIYIFDAVTLRFIQVNKGARDNLGYSMGELSCMTPLDLNPEFTRERFERLIAPLRQHGDGQKLEFKIVHRRKDGTRYPVEVHLQHMQFEASPVFVAIILDITDRQQAERQLRESHELLEQRVRQRTAELGSVNRKLRGQVIEREQAERQAQAFLESAPDAMTIVSRTGEIQFVNAQAERLFGYSKEELRSMKVEALMPERFRTKHVDDRRDYFANPRVRSMGNGMGLFALTKDGRELPIEVSLSPIRGEAGHLVSAGIRDITERKQADEELRTAKTEAERANATKSRFLATASHDLRQPLQSLGMYLSALTRQLVQSDDREIASKMNQSLHSMGELLDTLLDISKLDSGSVVPELRDFSVQHLLARIASDLVPQAQEKGLQLRVVSSSCVLHSDPVLLKRIVENFVSNAIRYTDAGRVVVGCRRRQRYVRIEVWDSGIGVPQEALGTIFEEYFQLDNPVRDRTQGLGLGLAIVKHIARLLDHKLDVSSRSGKGSMFAVEVPVGEHLEDFAMHAEPGAPASATADAPILFIDDDPIIVDATSLLFKSMGYQLFTAMDGDQALKHLKDDVRPAIVVSDYRLPKQNGVEVIKRVRELVGDIPAIIMTGDTSAEEIEAAKLHNCRVLHKPVDTDKLIGLIEQMM
ncbi:MAG: PAS domain S-box protein [Gammaproteobacteria bacterium]|nr:PAS domain S-box protein [Gammaproteobacteria bacterium]